MPRRTTLWFFAFLAVFAATFWILMRFAARGAGSPPPASAVWGVPDRPVRFVSYNILHNQRGMSRVIEEIRKLDPDFILLQEVERDELSDMTRDLGSMPAVYHASENLAGGRATWGNAILSRHRLYEGRSIPNPGGGSFGVWATAVIEGKKFRVGCVHLSATYKLNLAHFEESAVNRYKELSNLVKAWEDDGRPPIVIGGDFNQLAVNKNYELMTRHWADGLKVLGKDQNTFQAGLLRTRIDYFLLSKEWRPLDGGVPDTDASDHKPIWIRAVKGSS
jgi:endonuclease/exonuclease/phosphatase family metal-dependent hydrolase